MKIKLGDFRVAEDVEVDLGKWPTAVKSVYRSKEHYHALLDRRCD
ncbi:hypothetical protein PQQ96_41525 [Paraburkholderia sediminicola]